jgi:hypothetical protein
MYAHVFKSSEAAKKAWASRKKGSKDFWAKGPSGKTPKPTEQMTKKLDHAGSLSAALGIM